MTNALKHSACTKLFITVHVDGSIVRVLVTDNGKGFDIHKSVKGRGLGTMRARGKTLGYPADITSEPGKGTTVTIGVRI